MKTQRLRIYRLYQRNAGRPGVLRRSEEGGNLYLAISLEGSEDVNDQRRGEGVYQKVMHAMDLLKENGCLFGTSICYTSSNYEKVTSDEFIQMEIDKGVKFSMYFHYMPVGNDASPDLLPTKEQRIYMYHRIREIRNMISGKGLFCFDFQNDGEYVGGCIAGGRNYFHINANGDAEPCVFIHYSNANIKEKSLLEVLHSPIFMAYHDSQPFNENPLRPCPMLENPDILPQLVRETGQSPQICNRRKVQTTSAPSAISMPKAGGLRLTGSGRLAARQSKKGIDHQRAGLHGCFHRSG